MQHLATYGNFMQQKMSSNIRIQRTCAFCMRIFIAKKTNTKCCGDYCAKRFYKQRKRHEKINHAVSIGELSSTNVNETASKMTQEFLSIEEVCVLIGASRWTIHRLIKSGKLNHAKFGRLVRIHRSAIDNLLMFKTI